MGKKKFLALATIVGVGAAGYGAYKYSVMRKEHEEYLNHKLNTYKHTMTDVFKIDSHVHNGKVCLYKSVPSKNTDEEGTMYPVVLDVDDFAIGNHKVMMVKMKGKWYALNTTTMDILEYTVDDFKWVDETDSTGNKVTYLVLHHEDADTCLTVKDNGAVKSRHTSEYFEKVSEETDSNENPDINIKFVE